MTVGHRPFSTSLPVELNARIWTIQIQVDASFHVVKVDNSVPSWSLPTPVDSQLILRYRRSSRLLLNSSPTLLFGSHIDLSLSAL